MQVMGEEFCKQFAQPSEDNLGSHVEFARRRMQLGEIMYYKVLENIMVNEQKRAKNKDKHTDFSVSVCFVLYFIRKRISFNCNVN